MTPEDQLLKPAVAKIEQGVQEFSRAVDARQQAGGREWTVEHLSAINKLRYELVALLIDVKKETDDTR